MKRRWLTPWLLVAAAPLAACAAYSDIGPAPGEAAARRMPVQAHDARTGGGNTFVILYSGDGGASGGNRAISNDVAARGVPVVEVDSLAYFWRSRPIEAAAADLEALIAHYAAQWRARHVVLAGYSFGGSALPGIVRRLPDALRAKIRSVVLIAPRDYVEMTLRPHSWINIRPPHARPLIGDLKPLAGTRLVCVYGEKDKLAACPRLPTGLAEVHRLPGGHKFDGDYAGVGAILAAEARPDPGP